MKYNFFFASPTAVLGGAERVMFNIIMMLLEEGHHVTMYVMSRGEQEGWDKIKDHPNLNFIVKNYGSEKTSLPMFLLSLIYLSYKNNYDFSFSSHTHVNGVLSFMRKLGLFKTKYLISRESTVIFERFFGLWRFIFKLIYRFMYGKQDLIICQTERMETSLIANLGYAPAKVIEVFPNPVNLTYISEQLASSQLEKKPFSTLIVGCGRLISLKKFDHLIISFANVASDFPNTGLVIIGDGPERESLAKLVETLDLTDRVIFTGKISNPIQWFAKADIGIISSEIEGFPNVLIEMMASGSKQIITTPCTDGVNSIPYISITQDCSIEAIETSLRANLKNPIDNSFNNKEYINQNRSVEAFWQKVEELIK
ncbi:glycosyltransferase [Alkanindiges illinoisensis]|uniref:glycosyltransferase n=1 Tax=Alkanindiges illinoisensis TaxID=197183 RepID=UPI00047AA35B|nr:glycosyltransferase [Alkanindiges illinoisensis]